MSGAEHARARDLFLEALDRPPGERSAHLDRACGGDPGLRREVESLLSHHDPVSLFERPGMGETGAGEQTLAARSTRSSSAWRSSSFFASSAHRLLWVIAAAGALLVLGLWTHSRVERALFQLQAAGLETVVQAKVDALDAWIAEQKGQLALLAADPRLVGAARELLDAGRGRTSRAAIAAWRRHPARQRLLQLGRLFADKTHSRRWLGLADDHGVVVFSPSEAEVGLRVNAEGRRYLTRALEGETAFVRPYRMGDLIGDYSTGTMYTWVVTPLTGTGGETIGVLTASQDSYGPSSISSVLAAEIDPHDIYKAKVELTMMDGVVRHRNGI